MSFIEVLLGLALWLGSSIVGLAVATWLLVELPATYFRSSHERDWWIDEHPLLRWTARILKNVLGAFVLLLGIVLALPGVPGPGFLTILIGITLLDFPGKRRLELWLIRRPMVRHGIDRIRRRYGKPPLDLDEPVPQVPSAANSG